MTSENCSLKWDDFSSSAASTFQSLMTDPDFTDVTLVGSDHQQVRAHQVVLSSSSPVLREMLVAGPSHHNPLIYLRGVPSLHIKALVGFCYQGEAEIARDQLESFLELANELKVNGLCDEDANHIKLETKKKPHKEQKRKPSEKMNCPKITVEFEENQTEFEIVEPTMSLEITNAESKAQNNTTCEECITTFVSVAVLKRHVKEKHYGIKLSCKICDWTTERKYRLNTHMQKNHTPLE